MNPASFLGATRRPRDPKIHNKEGQFLCHSFSKILIQPTYSPVKVAAHPRQIPVDS